MEALSTAAARGRRRPRADGGPAGPASPELQSGRPRASTRASPMLDIETAARGSQAPDRRWVAQVRTRARVVRMGATRTDRRNPSLCLDRRREPHPPTLRSRRALATILRTNAPVVALEQVDRARCSTEVCVEGSAGVMEVDRTIAAEGAAPVGERSHGAHHDTFHGDIDGAAENGRVGRIAPGAGGHELGHLRTRGRIEERVFTSRRTDFICAQAPTAMRLPPSRSPQRRCPKRRPGPRTRRHRGELPLAATTRCQCRSQGEAARSWRWARRATCCPVTPPSGTPVPERSSPPAPCTR